MTTIFEMDERSGNIQRKASYSISARESLRNYIMQTIHKNMNWWTYPYKVKGMREVDGRWYWDDIKRGKILAAYEM